LSAPVVGVPKTIDNDLSGTDYTFGFDTAVAICTEAIDRLHTTAESHNRVMVVEVMGRHAGWIAVMSGIAGGADMILIPERPVDVAEVCGEIQRRHARGKNFSIVVVSEGCELPGADDKGEVDQFGHRLLAKRGVGERLGSEIEQQTGFETRVTVLGHIQRGGSPTPRDRILATRFGLKAADLVDERKFGRMAALHGDEIVDVSLEEATVELKTVPDNWYEVGRAFFG
jgi:6-phosphofructokinase 1